MRLFQIQVHDCEHERANEKQYHTNGNIGYLQKQSQDGEAWLARCYLPNTSAPKKHCGQIACDRGRCRTATLSQPFACFVDAVRDM